MARSTSRWLFQKYSDTARLVVTGLPDLMMMEGVVFSYRPHEAHKCPREALMELADEHLNEDRHLKGQDKSQHPFHGAHASHK